ncbi:riboflavin kinase [Bacillus sp. V5-8f]|uniref:riboflavin kinase n=1 Tax=Bacillus sp. V5-8f TaxID=2053044 RepID=UPI0026878E67
MITGKVIRGNQIGRTIGYPTANILFDTKEPDLKKVAELLYFFLNPLTLNYLYL